MKEEVTRLPMHVSRMVSKHSSRSLCYQTLRNKRVFFFHQIPCNEQPTVWFNAIGQKFQAFEISNRIDRLARNICRKVGCEPLVALCVLKGGYQFFGDLMDAIRTINANSGEYLMINLFCL